MREQKSVRVHSELSEGLEVSGNELMICLVTYWGCGCCYHRRLRMILRSITAACARPTTL